ncbi:MAG TPA: glutamine synthetase [Hydrogenophaga sp.]|jgi:glutamine synthetase|uniref:glutamine synthetase family protein n=1 Tax=Hydrogenophaga TaxID=47420 RepID=UPI0008AE15C3|nr:MULTISPECIES: glutamine synthetase family protein [Hydrogenophaga]OGA79617.1 MAG: glutamine synthetase [Burkholderiales bacterium GWE1_65_30]OGA92728.1 MAG: glutamine synthetase [Burkholderiales bacterium GWF1_66_17]UCU96778.1 glutamine synthetase [Hydrogenophaga taeniospiralis]HAX21903.1 glutamine synthetase [Hydrogenophaga sp.]HBU21269.1 glutamine synthetase [Hydrogenophaga sp.]
MNVSTDSLREFLAQHRIHEVECVIPDMTGIARGKILPKDLFLNSGHMRLPKSVLLNTVNGQQPDNTAFVGDTDPDMVCVPDLATARMVPWAAEQVAVIIHDCEEFDGTPVALAPRSVLRRVLALYEAQGWQPVVAPEMEFYLVARHQNPHEPLQPPLGRTGKPEAGRQSYSIDAVNDFDPFFLELSRFCEVHRLGVETLIHEAGAGQMEINFTHGEPMDLADRVFLFKRTVRETALRHGIFATFMAKPMEAEPGSAMHIHQSILDAETKQNIFSLPDGSATPAFHHYIAGLQRYVPQIMPMLAPYVNSYRRLSRFMSAPINVQWGYDNRTCGIRVPESDAANRRLENRVPGVDVNPYLAMAATLGAGYLGMVEKSLPSEPMKTSAWDMDFELPSHMEDSIRRMRECEPVRDVFGGAFIDAFLAVKELEYATYNRVISSWEREHLLLLV